MYCTHCIALGSHWSWDCPEKIVLPPALSLPNLDKLGQLYGVDHPVDSEFTKPPPNLSRSEEDLHLKFEKESPRAKTWESPLAGMDPVISIGSLILQNILLLKNVDFTGIHSCPMYLSRNIIPYFFL